MIKTSITNPTSRDSDRNPVGACVVVVVILGRIAKIELSSLISVSSELVSELELEQSCLARLK
jgi:hypothetical protein